MQKSKVDRRNMLGVGKCAPACWKQMMVVTDERLGNRSIVTHTRPLWRTERFSMFSLTVVLCERSKPKEEHSYDAGVQLRSEP